MQGLVLGPLLGPDLGVFGHVDDTLQVFCGDAPGPVLVQLLEHFLHQILPHSVHDLVSQVLQKLPVADCALKFLYMPNSLFDRKFKYIEDPLSNLLHALHGNIIILHFF